jgi:hypothetical protein
MKIKEQANERTPSTQINTRFTLGNPIWEKTQLEGEAYALLSLLQLSK